MSRWPTSVRLGTKATCRKCGQVITFSASMSDWRDEDIPEVAKDRSSSYARNSEDGYSLKWEYMNKNWEHEDGSRRCPSGEGRVVLPREMCTEILSSSATMCGKKVSPENLAAGVYACGTHAKRVVEKIKRKEESERRSAEYEEASALRRWEHDEQKAAADWLRSNGLAAAIDVDRAFDSYQRDYRRFSEHNANFNPIMLMEAIQDNFVRKESSDDQGHS